MSSTGIRSTLARNPGWYLISALAGAIILVIAYHLYGKVPEDFPTISIGPLFNLAFMVMRVGLVTLGFAFGAIPTAFGLIGGLYHLLRYPDKESVRWVFSKIDKMFYPPIALIAIPATLRGILFHFTGMGPEGAVGVSPLLTVLSFIANVLGTVIAIGWLGVLAVGVYKMRVRASASEKMKVLVGDNDGEVGEACAAEGSATQNDLN